MTPDIASAFLWGFATAFFMGALTSMVAAGFLVIMNAVKTAGR